MMHRKTSDNLGFEQATGVDIGAVGGVLGRSMEQRGAPSPVLPPEQQILEEEEVRTPPRREAREHGSQRGLNIGYLRVGHKRFPKFVWTSGSRTSARSDGVTIGHQETQ